MRGLLVPVVAALMLAGSVASYGEQNTKINLKQLVQNQISQIKARGIKQEVSPAKAEAPAAGKTFAGEKNNTPAENNTSLENNASAEVLPGNESTGSEKVSENKLYGEKAPAENRALSEEKGDLKRTSSKSDNGIFLKAFILIDLSLLAALFVYWRRRKLKIGMAEKAKFKKNITKLRSEGRFNRRAKTQSDELRKRLQTDPVCELKDEAMLRSHARKLSVSQGELMLASRIRSLEKALE